MKIIGLCGFANSGKSTIAKRLVEVHGYKRLSFAARVKDVAAALYQFDRTRLDGQTPNDREWRETPDLYWSAVLKKGFTPRMALQEIGEGFRNFINPNIWVNIIEYEILKSSQDKIVIDDVRYVNERAILKDLGAKLYIVHRADKTSLTFPSDEYKRLWEEAYYEQVLSNTPTTLHRSEWDWLHDPSISKDPIIENCGDLDKFHKQIDIIGEM